MHDVQDVRISTNFPPELLADQHRRNLDEIPSRAETFRRLCQEALAKSAKPRKPRQAK